VLALTVRRFNFEQVKELRQVFKGTVFFILVLILTDTEATERRDADAGFVCGSVTKRKSLSMGLGRNLLRQPLFKYEPFVEELCINHWTLEFCSPSLILWVPCGNIQ